MLVAERLVQVAFFSCRTATTEIQIYAFIIKTTPLVSLLWSLLPIQPTYELRWTKIMPGIIKLLFFVLLNHITEQISCWSNIVKDPYLFYYLLNTSTRGTFHWTLILNITSKTMLVASNHKSHICRAKYKLVLPCPPPGLHHFLIQVLPVWQI